MGMVPKIKDRVAIVDAVETKSGWIGYAVSNKGLLATRFAQKTRRAALGWMAKESGLSGYRLEPISEKAARPWRLLFVDFFAGKARDLSRVPVDDSRWPAFTRRVYRHVRSIPWGEVRTYGQVARAVGSPGAARAVGQAMARNPVAPIVPCHRVIGSDGSLCGFSGAGGLALKARMLEQEGAR